MSTLPTDDAAQLWKLNQLLLTRILNAATPELAELGLDTKEFFVLDEVDSCRYPAVIAQKLMLPKASVTIYLRNLVAAGLVRRDIDDTDLRRHQLSTTVAGRDVLGRALAALATEFSRMLSRIDDDDRAHLDRILHLLLDQE